MEECGELNPSTTGKPVFGDKITWIQYTEGFGGSQALFVPIRRRMKKKEKKKNAYNRCFTDKDNTKKREKMTARGRWGGKKRSKLKKNIYTERIKRKDDRKSLLSLSRSPH